MLQLCDLDGMIEQLTANLHGIQGWRDRLAARIKNAPKQFSYPVTDHQRVMRIVPAVTSVKWSRIIGKQRSRKVVNARWHAITMLSDCPSNYTCSQIGRFLKKDHSSILNARKAYIKRYVSDLEFQQTAELCWHKFWEERL